MVLRCPGRGAAMSARRRGKKRVGRGKPKVLIFGESRNDRQSIKILLGALEPGLEERFDIQEISEPPSLNSSIGPEKIRNWLSAVARVVKAQEATGRVHAVLLHQDSDEYVESKASARDLIARLEKEGISAHIQLEAVIPVEELEAWWLMFPEAVRKVNPGAWAKVKFPGGDTSRISNPKERLVQITRKAAAKKRYNESHSIAIAENIRALGAVPDGHNPSWDEFKRIAHRIAAA